MITRHKSNVAQRSIDFGPKPTPDPAPYRIKSQHCGRHTIYRERRLFAYIAQSWRGTPLVSHQVIVQSIGSTTTETGLKVCCEIDGNLYPKDVKVSDQEIATLNTKGNAFHPERNYTISPNQQPP
jgi:Rhodopirellula transposase DDE domain